MCSFKAALCSFYSKFFPNKMYLWNAIPLQATQSEKALFKGHSLGHKVIDLDVTWKGNKGIISGVCMQNMKSLSPTEKIIAKVKVDNR